MSLVQWKQIDPELRGDGQLTGSLEISGSIILNGIEINTDGIVSDQVSTVFYVSPDGSDTNEGKTLGTAFRTIKKACEVVTDYINSQPLFPTTRVNIEIKSGYYTEVAPITVPSNTSLLGDDLRTTVISPTSGSKGENLFLMNNACYASGLRLQGCEVDDLENPTKGFYFAFAPGAFITTSPYVQNCSAIHTPPLAFYASLDFQNENPAVGKGPGGMLVDDSVLHPSSPLKSMVVDAYTQVAFNGIGICLRGRGYAQLVSFFTNFNRVGVYCIDGAQASLLNSNTSFGDYGLRAKGSRVLLNPDVSNVPAGSYNSASVLLSEAKEDIVDYMWNFFASGSNPSGIDYNNVPNYEEATKRDARNLIDALAVDLVSEQPGRTVQYVNGFFGLNVVPLFPSASVLTPDFIYSYEKMFEYIVSESVLQSTPATDKVEKLIEVVSETLDSVIVREEDIYKQTFGSLITTTSHDFSYAGAGVNFLALPPNQGGIGKTNFDIRVVEEDGGRVYYSGGDETGDFYVSQGLKINQEIGIIQGRTFSKSLFSLVTPFVLALESN
jgi:hypothetical protein